MSGFQQFAMWFLVQSVLILAVACVASFALRASAARAALIRNAFFGVILATVFRAAFPFLANERVLPPGRFAQPVAPPWVILALFGGWAIGSAFLLARIALGFRQLSEVQASGETVAYSRIGDLVKGVVARFDLPAVRLIESSLVATPFVGGLRSPAVFLPLCQSSEFEAFEVESMVAFGLSSVARRDSIAITISNIVAALCWPNPFAWIALRRQRKSLVEASDAAVLAGGIRADDYEICLSRLPGNAKRPTVLAPITLSMSDSDAKPDNRLAQAHDQQATKSPIWADAGVLGAFAVASCLLIPSIQRGPAPPESAEAKAAETARFLPSAHELGLARAGTLPYLPGDFTVVYQVTTPDTQKPRHVTLTCRSGRLLYMDGGYLSVLITRDKQYDIRGSEGSVGDVYRTEETPLMPLPAAGFAHFPLSHRLAARTPNKIEIADAPAIGVPTVMSPWDGGLKANLTRCPAIATFAGRGLARHLVALDEGSGKPQYEFQQFVPLKGVQIATQYTIKIGRRRYDYSMLFYGTQPAPEEEFRPGQFFRGRQVRTVYRGRALDFVADPAGSDFDTQIEAQFEKVR